MIGVITAEPKVFEKHLKLKKRNAFSVRNRKIVLDFEDLVDVNAFNLFFFWMIRMEESLLLFC